MDVCIDNNTCVFTVSMDDSGAWKIVTHRVQLDGQKILFTQFVNLYSTRGLAQQKIKDNVRDAFNRSMADEARNLMDSVPAGIEFEIFFNYDPVPLTVPLIGSNLENVTMGIRFGSDQSSATVDLLDLMHDVCAG